MPWLALIFAIGAGFEPLPDQLRGRYLSQLIFESRSFSNKLVAYAWMDYFMGPPFFNEKCIAYGLNDEQQEHHRRRSTRPSLSMLCGSVHGYLLKNAGEKDEEEKL